MRSSSVVHKLTLWLLRPLLLLPLLWSGWTLGLDPLRNISEFSHEVWTTEHGLPQNTVHSITQTRDGFIWIATEEGLARFDSLGFTVFDKQNTAELRSNDIHPLLEDAQGRLWIGTAGGLVQLQEGKFRPFSDQGNYPDITLIDLRMPVLSGVEAITAIRREFPDAHLIVLTTYDGDEDIYRSLQAGAQGYLLKDMFFEELEDAIRKVHAGLRRIPAQVAERLAERMSGTELTARELEVLKQIVRGKSNKEIAGLLKIGEATVKSHINNILSKLGVTDRTQAATTALQRGIVHF